MWYDNAEWISPFDNNTTAPGGQNEDGEDAWIAINDLGGTVGGSGDGDSNNSTVWEAIAELSSTIAKYHNSQSPSVITSGLYSRMTNTKNQLGSNYQAVVMEDMSAYDVASLSSEYAFVIGFEIVSMNAKNTLSDKYISGYSTRFLYFNASYNSYSAGRLNFRGLSSGTYQIGTMVYNNVKTPYGLVGKVIYESSIIPSPTLWLTVHFTAGNREADYVCIGTSRLGGTKVDLPISSVSYSSDFSTPSFSPKLNTNKNYDYGFGVYRMPFATVKWVDMSLYVNGELKSSTSPQYNSSTRLVTWGSGANKYSKYLGASDCIFSLSE